MQLKIIASNRDVKEKRIRSEPRFKSGIVIEKGMNLFVKCGSEVFSVDSQSFSPRGGIQMYSLPSNPLFESYTPMPCTTTDGFAIRDRYSRIKPGMKVKGVLVKDEYLTAFKIVIYNA